MRKTAPRRTDEPWLTGFTCPDDRGLLGCDSIDGRRAGPNAQQGEASVALFSLENLNADTALYK